MRPAATYAVCQRQRFRRAREVIYSHETYDRETYHAAPNNQDLLVAHLPCEDERSSTLDLWKLFSHCGSVDCSHREESCWPS